MQQAPGARPNLDVGGSTTNAQPAFRAFGQQGQSWQSVDGVVIANPKSDTQSGNYMDYSSLEEATIQTIGHDASSRPAALRLTASSKRAETISRLGIRFRNQPQVREQQYRREAEGGGISAGNTLSCGTTRAEIWVGGSFGTGSGSTLRAASEGITTASSSASCQMVLLC